MNEPLLSVALPVYNGAAFLEDSVRSILTQSFRDFELVIGDDGSTDGSSEVLRRLAEEDDRIRLLRREQPSGLSSSANWTISETRAPLVAIAHADDRSRPLRLQRQMEAFAERPDAVLVGTLNDGIDEHGRIVRPSDCWRLFHASPFAPFGHSSIMFRRDAFDAVGGYREAADHWEDLDLYFRIGRLGPILVLPEVLTSIRHSGSSTRLRNNPDTVEDSVDLMYRSADAYWKSGDHEQVVVQAAQPGRKLYPRTFIARGSTHLWSGTRVRVLRRMLRRGRLELNVETVRALVWAAWGEVSPRTLRLVIRTLLHLRNRAAERRHGGRAIEWHPSSRRLR